MRALHHITLFALLLIPSATWAQTAVDVPLAQTGCGSPGVLCINGIEMRRPLSPSRPGLRIVTETVTPAAPVVPVETSPLANTEWTFTDVNGGKISSPSGLVIHFYDDTFQMIMCNRHAGGYSLSGKRMDFLFATESGSLRCPRRAGVNDAAAVEMLFLRALDHGYLVSLDNHRLSLTGKGNTIFKLIRKDWRK